MILLLSFHIYLVIIGKTTKERIGTAIPRSEANAEQTRTEVIILERIAPKYPVSDPKNPFEAQEEKQPFLYFAMALNKEESNYLLSYELCQHDTREQ